MIPRIYFFSYHYLQYENHIIFFFQKNSSSWNGKNLYSSLWCSITTSATLILPSILFLILNSSRKLFVKIVLDIVFRTFNNASWKWQTNITIPKKHSIGWVPKYDMLKDWMPFSKQTKKTKIVFISRINPIRELIVLINPIWCKK